jgi:hypothetical protein
MIKKETKEQKKKEKLKREPKKKVIVDSKIWK